MSKISYRLSIFFLFLLFLSSICAGKKSDDDETDPSSTKKPKPTKPKPKPTTEPPANSEESDETTKPNKSKPSNKPTAAGTENDNEGGDATEPAESSGLTTGTIIALVLIPISILPCVGYFIYKKCIKKRKDDDEESGETDSKRSKKHGTHSRLGKAKSLKGHSKNANDK